MGVQICKSKSVADVYEPDTADRPPSHKEEAKIGVERLNATRVDETEVSSNGIVIGELWSSAGHALTETGT
jgi:hypothetical protein